MEWLEEADAQAKAIRDRLMQIVEHEGEIYEALWSELKAHIEAARAKSFPQLFTNGEPLSRVIGLPQSPVPPAMSASPKTIKIQLVKIIHSICIYGPGKSQHPSLKLQVDVCDDGVVCLTLDGMQISLKNAAIAILRPFLYPELNPDLSPEAIRPRVV